MTKCKSCGALIKRIRTAEGEQLYIDAEPVHVLPNCVGDTRIITENGTVFRGDKDWSHGQAYPDSVSGHTPHTCSDAKGHREK